LVEYRFRLPLTNNHYVVGGFSKTRRRRRRERHQTKGLMSRTMVLHLRSEFWYISLPSSAKQQREMTKFYFSNGSSLISHIASYSGHSGCLPFTRKNRLVDSSGKWNASNPEWKSPRGYVQSISTTFSRKIGSKAIQAKRFETSKN